jgi:hypothetical protein
MTRELKVEQTFAGKNVRNWRVSGCTVRESALYPGVYLCLTCLVATCEHVDAVRAFDRAGAEVTP